jgi:hypothetical protein
MAGREGVAVLTWAVTVVSGHPRLSSRVVVVVGSSFVCLIVATSPTATWPPASHVNKRGGGEGRDYTHLETMTTIRVVTIWMTWHIVVPRRRHRLP